MGTIQRSRSTVHLSARRPRSTAFSALRSTRQKAAARRDAYQEAASLLPNGLRRLAWLRAFVSFALDFSRAARAANSRHTTTRPRLRAVLARALKAFLRVVQSWGTPEGKALAGALARSGSTSPVLPSGLVTAKEG